MARASEIMDTVAATMLNDPAKTVYTYAVQLPYLNLAIDELNEIMQLNNVAFTNEVEDDIEVLTGILSIGGGGTDPVLPVGLVEIRALYERTSGTSEPFVLMTRREFLPVYTEQQLQSLVYWCWIGQVIRFVGATSDREVRIQYIKNRLPRMQNEGGIISTINAKTFLEYRTGALISAFIDENNERAMSLNGAANEGLDRFLGINTKGKQAMPVRRRPFRSGYKSVNYNY